MRIGVGSQQVAELVVNCWLRNRQPRQQRRAQTERQEQEESASQKFPARQPVIGPGQAPPKVRRIFRRAEPGQLCVRSRHATSRSAL